MWVVVVSVIFLLVFGYLFVRGMRWAGRRCVKHHYLSSEAIEAAIRTPRCACYYSSDGGPYGLPHWVNGKLCEQYYLSHGEWPDWCHAR